MTFVNILQLKYLSQFYIINVYLLTLFYKSKPQNNSNSCQNYCLKPPQQIKCDI